MQRCSRLAHAVDDMQHLVRSAVDVLGHRVIVVVVEIDVAGELLQRFNALLYSAVPPRKADLVLQLQDRTLAALDGVAYTLAGDAEVVRDLRKGEVVVVILLHHVALFFRQHVAVKIKQVRNFEVFCNHRGRSFSQNHCVKQTALHSLFIIPHMRCKVKAFSAVCPFFLQLFVRLAHAGGEMQILWKTHSQNWDFIV